MATTALASASDDPISSGLIASALGGLQFSSHAIGIDIKLTPSVTILAGDIMKLGLDIRSFREPLTRAIKQVIIPSIDKNFQVGGRPGWETLKEGTIRNRHFSAWPILEVTGKLRRRATQFNIWSISQTDATIPSLPSDVFYGAFHQGGAPPYIPQRQFVMYQDEDVEKVQAVFLEWMTERAAAAGRFVG